MSFIGNLAEGLTSVIKNTSAVVSTLTQDADSGAALGTEAIISENDIVKQGWLSKESRNVKEWRRRYVVLTNDCLATFHEGPRPVYQAREATELVFFTGLITVRSAEHECGKENSFCLQRQKDGKFFFFVCETASEKESWVGSIGKAMVRRTVMIEEDDG